LSTELQGICQQIKTRVSVKTPCFDTFQAKTLCGFARLIIKWPQGQKVDHAQGGTSLGSDIDQASPPSQITFGLEGP
jgi:hypothetical protein